jgi:hypothetical protein
MLGDEPGVVIPRVHDDLTTAHILAMDYVDGAPLDVLAEPGHSQRQRDRVGAILYRILLRELFELHTCRPIRTSPTTCCCRAATSRCSTTARCASCRSS